MMLAPDAQLRRPGAVVGSRNRLLPLAGQYLRFGIVGLAATATHVALFVLAIELAGLLPLAANAAAFGVAVAVSFLGHFRWTFRPDAVGAVDVGPRPGPALVRFVAVALTGLALNSLAVYLVVGALAASYLYAVALMVSAVPLVVFGLSRFWAFA